MTPISRDEAKANRQKFYFTGHPCKHGHIANRYTSNNICVVCQSISNQRHWTSNREELVKQHRERLSTKKEEYNANRRKKYEDDDSFREYIKQLSKDWYVNNREMILANPTRRARQAQYDLEHRDHIRQYSSTWRARNRDHVNEQARAYREQNRSYYNAKQAAYRAQKVLATPTWCEHDEVTALYEQARLLSQETEVPHHVDHVVPLVHPLVCGLHCLANLQILTERDNKAKNNKFIVS